MTVDRLMLEYIAQAIAEGLETSLGGSVEIGLHGRFDETQLGRTRLPMRAALVSLAAPLADCVIGISGMKEEHLASAMAAAAKEIPLQLGVEADISPPELHEYEERAEAYEQLDALYNEPTVHFTTPVGELLLVIGRGLVAAVEKVMNAEADGAGGDAADAVPAQVLVTGSSPSLLAGAAGAAETGAFELEADMEAPVAAAEGEFAAMASAAGQSGDMAHAAATAGAPPQAGAPLPEQWRQTAEANVLAASPESTQISELLSGVEVELSAELGRTEMRLGDMASLRADSVLTLDQIVDDPVTVYVNGSLFATARLVVVDDEYGIEILEVIGEQALEASVA